MVRSAAERLLVSRRKVYPFWEKGAWFLEVRAILSWAQPPGHFDTVHLKCIAKVQLSKGPLAHFVRQQKKNFLFNGFLTFSGAEWLSQLFFFCAAADKQLWRTPKGRKLESHTKTLTKGGLCPESITLLPYREGLGLGGCLF